MRTNTENTKLLKNDKLFSHLNHLFQVDWETLPTTSNRPKVRKNRDTIDPTHLTDLIYQRLCSFDRQFSLISPKMKEGIKTAIWTVFVVTNVGESERQRCPTFAEFLLRFYAMTTGSNPVETDDDQLLKDKLLFLFSHWQDQCLPKRKIQ